MSLSPQKLMEKTELSQRDPKGHQRVRTGSENFHSPLLPEKKSRNSFSTDVRAPRTPSASFSRVHSHTCTRAHTCQDFAHAGPSTQDALPSFLFKFFTSPKPSSKKPFEKLFGE